MNARSLYLQKITVLKTLVLIKLFPDLPLIQSLIIYYGIVDFCNLPFRLRNQFLLGYKFLYRDKHSSSICNAFCIHDFTRNKTNNQTSK